MHLWNALDWIGECLVTVSCVSTSFDRRTLHHTADLTYACDHVFLGFLFWNPTESYCPFSSWKALPGMWRDVRCVRETEAPVKHMMILYIL